MRWRQRSSHAGERCHEIIIAAGFAARVDHTVLRFDMHRIAQSAQNLRPVIRRFLRNMPRPAFDDGARAAIAVSGNDAIHD